MQPKYIGIVQSMSHLAELSSAEFFTSATGNVYQTRALNFWYSNACIYSTSLHFLSFVFFKYISGSPSSMCMVRLYFPSLSKCGVTRWFALTKERSAEMTGIFPRWNLQEPLLSCHDSIFLPRKSQMHGALGTLRCGPSGMKR